MYCGARYTPMWRRGPKGPGKKVNENFILIIYSWLNLIKLY